MVKKILNEEIKDRCEIIFTHEYVKVNKELEEEIFRLKKRIEILENKDNESIQTIIDCKIWHERYFKQQDELKDIINTFNTFFIRLNQLENKLCFSTEDKK